MADPQDLQLSKVKPFHAIFLNNSSTFVRVRKKKVLTSLKKQFGAFMGLYPQFLAACFYANSNLTPCGVAIILGSMKKHSRKSETVLNTHEREVLAQI
jgi:hypothetical protein